MEGPQKPFNTDNTLEIQRLELALESAGLGTWELDFDTNQIRWCNRAKRLFDFTGSDIVDFQTLLAQVYPEDRSLVEHEFSQAFSNVSPICFSLELRTLDAGTGQFRWLLCKGQSHIDSVNNTVRLLGTFVDVTKEMENRGILKDNRNQARSFQTIVEQAPIAIALLRGPEMIIELGNDKIFDVWGKDASITGMQLTDALPEIRNQNFPELLQQVYQTGEPYLGNGLPARINRNNVMQDVYFDFVYTPMRDEGGHVTGIMVMATEVTRQYNALKQLEASEARFRTLIEEIPVGVSLFTGKDMIVELINEPMAQYWGKDMSVVGKSLREALPELDGQPFHQILDDIYTNGNSFTAIDAPVDLEVDGKLSTYYFNFAYKPLFDDSGKVYSIIDMSFDVTAQVLAKKALQESESKLRTVIASAPAAIGLFTGRDLIVELPNQTFIDIVGKGPDITGKPLRDIMPELENQPFLQILDDVYTTGITYQSFGTQVNIVQHGVMNHNYYDITYSPIFDSEGKVYAILDIAIDVTDRVNVERQVQESQMQLLSLFEQSPIGIAMIRKDDLVFTMTNPFYGQLVGRKPEEITGKPLLEALPEMQGQGFDILLHEVTNTGVPYLSKEQAVNIMYDGVLQTIYVNLAYQPQRDMDNNIIGVLVVATDLTEQVLSRKKIEETGIFLRGAIELAELGTYSIDLKTGIIDYSDRLKQWFSLDKEEQITFEKVYAAISKPDLQSVIDAVNQAIASESDGIYDMEYSMDAEKTGFARILHAQGRVVYDENGKPVTLIGTAQDVTVQRKIQLALELQVQERTEELEAMNEELAAINEEYIATNEELSDSNNLLMQSNVNLQQFAYVASHDLQEPLRKIQSFSNLIASRYGEKLGDGVNYLQRMQSAATRMSELINDLLAFSRITTQKESTENVSLTKIVNEILNDLELVILESSAQITVSDLPKIQGDKTQLSQLFLNLVSNALKFRKPDTSPVIDINCQLISSSEIPLSLVLTRVASTYYQIDVADNGIGFEQKYADRIFQLFQRLHGRSEYSGTGIGLAICERVAANHGGGISVVSQPGEGTTFSVFLPVT